MIKIITTGGIIEGLDYEGEKYVQATPKVRISDFLKIPNLTFNFTIEEAACEDSRFISFEDKLQLINKIERTKEERILITLDTISMFEIAKLLGELNFEKTIVLVGAFISGTEKNTDAPFNLGFALCALQFLDRGVYIAMNGGIITWTNVLKIENVNQFIFKN